MLRQISHTRKNRSSHAAAKLSFGPTSSGVEPQEIDCAEIETSVKMLHQALEGVVDKATCDERKE